MGNKKTPYKAYRDIKKSLKTPANSGRGPAENSVRNTKHKSTGTRAKQKALSLMEEHKSDRAKKPSKSKYPTVTSRASGGGMGERGFGAYYDAHKTKGGARVGGKGGGVGRTNLDKALDPLNLLNKGGMVKKK